VYQKSFSPELIDRVRIIVGTRIPYVWVHVRRITRYHDGLILAQCIVPELEVGALDAAQTKQRQTKAEYLCIH